MKIIITTVLMFSLMVNTLFAIQCPNIPVYTDQPGTYDGSENYVTNDQGETMVFDSHMWVARNAWYYIYDNVPKTGGWYHDGTYYYWFEYSEMDPPSASQLWEHLHQIIYVPATECPAPPEPAHCSDGIKSGDETDVDCGGSCNNECDLDKDNYPNSCEAIINK